jgi:hypothetical protein
MKTPCYQSSPPNVSEEQETVNLPRCYQCEKPVTYLFKDGRCYNCTRLTIEEFTGGETIGHSFI